jgi:hypothetical protein
MPRGCKNPKQSEIQHEETPAASGQLDCKEGVSSFTDTGAPSWILSFHTFCGT